MNSKVFELNKLLSELDDQEGYFIDFIITKGIQAGIIRLHPGENDTQEPHSVDEVYYVIEGNGFIPPTFREVRKDKKTINFSNSHVMSSVYGRQM